MHARIRSWAESIALYGGDAVEKECADTKFDKLQQNKFRLIRWHWGITGKFVAKKTLEKKDFFYKMILKEFFFS